MLKSPSAHVIAPVALIIHINTLLYNGQGDVHCYRVFIHYKITV